MFDTIIPALNLQIQSLTTGPVVNPTCFEITADDEILSIDVRILRRLSIEEKMVFMNRGQIPEFADNHNNLCYELSPRHYQNKEDALVTFNNYQVVERDKETNIIGKVLEFVSLFPYLSEIVRSTWLMKPMTSFDETGRQIIHDDRLYAIILKRKDLYSKIVNQYEQLTQRSVRVRLANYSNSINNGLWVVYGEPKQRHA